MDSSTVFDVVTGIALGLQVLAAVVCVVKIGTCRHLQDRIVALDLLLAVVVGGAAIYSAREGLTAFLDVLVVGVLITFIGSILAARLLTSDRPR
ncbi:monovalent cation/H+ antiporter complex subunit F [Euzebya sp.]|uniref:monovalent cation/H+ antiporter complex subunit F n=1 Tax=Euzebya sp. TaxID=1971409 RepID=UPI0035196F82